jgi:YegS/Rv2252/BmrU family lipid kinase
MDKVAVVISLAAGKGRSTEWAEGLAEVFRAAGVEAQISASKDADAVAKAVQGALADGARTVVAGGGDGTVNQVASALAGSDIVLGVLPLGTLNHFAKDLGLPLDVDAAIKVIADGHVIEVDTGEVDGKMFLNNSSLGLYPEIVAEREKISHRLGKSKWLALVWASVTAFRRFPFMTVTLETDGKKLVRRSAFVFIGNNAYVMEGFDIGARKRLDSGLLSVCVSGRTGRLGLLRLAISALFGRLHHASNIDLLSTRDLLIETPHAQLPVSSDGEVNPMRAPLRYRSRPRNLRVLAPRGGPKSTPMSAGSATGTREG